MMRNSELPSAVAADPESNFSHRRMGRFTSLLMALFFLLFVSPFVGVLNNSGLENGQQIGRVILGIAFSLVLISTALAVSDTKRHRLLTMCLVGIIVVVYFVAIFVEMKSIHWLRRGLPIIFLTYSIVMIIRFSFQTDTVELDTVSASLCGYLLIGICFSSAYSVIYELNPSSFGSHLESEWEQADFQLGNEHSTDSLYFSFVTLTTLGYGDVTPTSDVAKVLTVVEALIGQIYLVVLVARLVGLHVSHLRYS